MRLIFKDGSAFFQYYRQYTKIGMAVDYLSALKTTEMIGFNEATLFGAGDSRRR